MIHSPACPALVTQFDTFLAHATPDPKSHGKPWTIGFGHAGPDVHPGMIWDMGKARAVLNLDLAMSDSGINHLIGNAPTTQQMFDALSSLAFNLGAGKLHGSHLIGYHITGHFQEAANEFLRWDNPGSNVEAGLLRRRKAERLLYLSGGFPK